MPLYRIKTLQEKHGDLNSIIPALVNEVGQSQAAAQLGISTATISKWLTANGYKGRMIFEREYKIGEHTGKQREL